MYFRGALTFDISCRRESGNTLRIGEVLTKLGDVKCLQDKYSLYAEAVGHYDEALAIAITLSDRCWQDQLKAHTLKSTSFLPFPIIFFNGATFPDEVAGNTSCLPTRMFTEADSNVPLKIGRCSKYGKGGRNSKGRGEVHEA
jgi:hypothetical protein